LESSPSLPLPATALAIRLSMRRGGWRVPRDVALVKAVDTAAYVGLMIEAHDRGLSGKRGDWLIAHLDPHGTHILIPRRPGDVFFGPRQDGVWEYRSLLRMNNGETVVGNLRTHTERYDAVPSGLTRPEQMRLAALPIGRDRDVYLWRRDHLEGARDCPACEAVRSS
jgi:hypothetical protein